MAGAPDCFQALTGALRVRNKPSDPTGERAVGNALAVLGVCAK